jgi:hypothetical protein
MGMEVGRSWGEQREGNIVYEKKSLFHLQANKPRVDHSSGMILKIVVAEEPESAGYRRTYHRLGDLEPVQDTAFDDSSTRSFFFFFFDCQVDGNELECGSYEPGTYGRQ